MENSVVVTSPPESHLLHITHGLVSRVRVGRRQNKRGHAANFCAVSTIAATADR